MYRLTEDDWIWLELDTIVPDSTDETLLAV